MTSVDSYALAATGERDDLIARYAPLVKRIAYHMIGRLPPSVQPDDLIQAGMIGLLEATRNYSASHGASFETYAGIRIRGSMIDEIRRNDWAPRSVHRKLRELADAVRRVEAREGRGARDTEIDAEVGGDLNEYYSLLQEVSSHRVLSIEDLSAGSEGRGGDLADSGGDPARDLQEKDTKACITTAIGRLPERERLVLALYYDEELNLKEIGAVLGVSESRVCQIHGQALTRLQGLLEQGTS